MSRHTPADRVRLAAACGELTEALSGVEDALSDLQLHFPVAVPLAPGYALAFRRVGKLWRLLVEPAGGVTYPLVDASRALRVTAVTQLAVLLAALRAEAAVAETNVRAATAAARTFAASVGRNPPV